MSLWKSSIPRFDCIVSYLFIRYMYWNDWSQDYKIERAWLDGTHREVVINNIGRSYGLTIDYVDRRLYWTDIDKKRIESADMEGRFSVIIQ